MTAFIDEFREEFEVEPICRVLPIAASSYYARKAAEADPTQASGRAQCDAKPRDQIRALWLVSRGLYIPPAEAEKRFLENGQLTAEAA